MCVFSFLDDIYSHNAPLCLCLCFCLSLQPEQVLLGEASLSPWCYPPLEGSSTLISGGEQPQALSSAFLGDGSEKIAWCHASDREEGPETGVTDGIRLREGKRITVVNTHVPFSVIFNERQRISMATAAPVGARSCTEWKGIEG